MTEEDWLTSSDPVAMLAFLHEASPVSERKVRLFSNAVCDGLLALVDDPRLWNLNEVAERFADALATEAELREAREAVLNWYQGPWYDSGDRDWEDVDNIHFRMQAAAAVYCAAGGSVDNPGIPCEDVFQHVYETLEWIHRAQAIRRDSSEESTGPDPTVILRCIFGYPNRAMAIDASLGAGNTCQNLARQIYDQRNYCDLPLLADALEDAGCRDRTPSCSAI